jgi:hypothetical protein
MTAYAASGIKDIMEFAKDMNTYTATLPDDLKPIAQALTDFTFKLLTQSCIEYLMMLSELGYQEITWTGLPPTDQTEPDLLKRSNNDAI